MRCLPPEKEVTRGGRPGPRGSSSGGDKVRSPVRGITESPHDKQPFPNHSLVSIMDGRRLLGHLRKTAKGWVSYDFALEELGTFESIEEARAAIRAAAR